MLNSQRQSGFSLIELMISLFLGSILLAMVLGLYVSGVSNAAKSLKYSRLRTDLQSMLMIIATDIRRSGYGGENYLIGPDNNKTIDLLSKPLASEPLSCLIFSYDIALDGNVSHMGYRYQFSDQTIQYGSGVSSAAVNCYSSGIWERLSDPQFIKIITLKFTEVVTSSAVATIRNVDIEIVGELAADSQFTHTVKTSVQVRNFEYK